MSHHLRTEIDENMAIVDCEQFRARFIDKYSSSIDTSIILAILSDYDLTVPAQEAAAQNTLEFIRESTECDRKLLKKNRGCISSSTSEGQPSVSEDGAATESLQDWNTQTGASSSSSIYPDESTTHSNYYNKNLSKSSDENTPKINGSILEGLTEKGQEEALIAMFPALKVYDVTHTLQKANGDTDKAIDELITQSFLEESGERCKGINGFASNGESHTNRRRKPKKKRKKEALNVVGENNFGPPGMEQQSCWEIGRENIEFLSERTNITKSHITSLYYETGASLPRTISRLIESKSGENLKIDDDSTAAHIYQLADDFPSIAMPQIMTIYNLTQNNLSDTRDLLQKFSMNSKQKAPSGNEITVCHTPIKLNLEKNVASMTNSKTLFTNPDLRKNNSQMASRIQDKATELRDARNNAFQKATAAHRRGKSDRLMTAAATYYAEEGHNYHSQAKKAQSHAADLTAASQCSQNSLDLHGLSVQDAVRITREYVTNWWHERSEGIRSGRGPINSLSSYQIITGTGSHSKDGISKLGPAVSKMLKRDGWKFEARTGILIVTGVSKS